jgi:murein DD-endopeptidase MepM/ murein hydrolase activator NlpD
MATSSLGQELGEFLLCLGRYSKNKAFLAFRIFEKTKSWLAARLYWQRGRLARPFVHSGMALLIIGGITLGPILIAENFPGLGENPWQGASPPSAVSAIAFGEMETSTLESIKPRADTLKYTVKPGDTVSTIADKFGVSVDTIRWENNLKTIKDIKPGQVLRILPVSGVSHKVKHGETIYSIAKRYQVNPQVIVDWPYNSFANDETFALAVGQTLIIPEGIMPKEVPTAPRRWYAEVPPAGTVTGTGQFAWPVSGQISQGFTWYHKGIDISNKAMPNILAADSGQVIVVGWPSPWAYGNRIIIDHGNGYQTLYAHLSQIYVSAGQRVSRGQVIGRMGSTGRSTGPHLHLEIRANGSALNPLNFLK